MNPQRISDHPTMRLLDLLNSPEDLRRLSIKQLPQVAHEIRGELLRAISQLGGHLASSLGAVELCLALHYVFEAPTDQLVWDMGYQAYAHKMLTGRRGRIHTLKQRGGLSGFNNKDESPYDLFTTGHGGTVLSTAMGLAMARDRAKREHQVVAVIGDASLGEGMALEALNHIGHVKPNLLVILNDNKMSIARPVGGLSRYLNRIITDPLYNRIHRDLERLIARLPHGSRLLRLGRKMEESLKGLFVPGLVFEELGFRYVGPIHGHDLKELIATLRNVTRLKGPILLHVLTVKGKGYRPAEQDPERFHKIEPFDVATGQLRKVESGKWKVESSVKRVRTSVPPTFTEAFSEELIRLAETNPRIVAITAAMPEGTGVAAFGKRFPQRFVDVGMAEQHALGLAAGLARGGLRPIVAIYSTFLQRAYDQLMHEISLQRLPVVLAIDRAGLVGEDGPTHHGVFDLAYLRVFPNLVVMSPRDPMELRAMLGFALEYPGPVAIRYSRGGVANGELPSRSSKIALGKAEVLRTGKDIAIFALGSLTAPAFKAAELLHAQGIDATVVNARFIKPVDRALVRQLSSQTTRFVTIEEAQVAGGFGSALAEACDELRLGPIAWLRIGLPDTFIEHGKRDELLVRCQLDAPSLARQIASWHTTLTTPAEDFKLIAESR